MNDRFSDSCLFLNSTEVCACQLLGKKYLQEFDTEID
jgi:hypothetical protein